MFKNAFSIVGGLTMLVGVGLVLAAVLLGSADLAIPGVMLLVMGFIFFRVGRGVGDLVWTGRKVLETGRPGRGTITRMWETGVTINEQPVFGFEMDLEVEGVAAGTASVQQMVPRMLAGAVLPGHIVAVKVDQEDPTEVVIDWAETNVPAAGGAPEAGAPSASDVAAALGAAVREGEANPPEPAADLLRSGRRGTAQLTAVADAGEIGELGLAGGDPDLADDRLYVIDLDVKLPGRSLYATRIGHRVPDRLIGRIGPGLEVQVAVDRDDDRSVAIDWDASLPPTSTDHAG